MADTVWIFYRNHRGEKGWRRIQPHGIRHGASEWHPGEQWLLEALDVDRGEIRTFALADVLSPWLREMPSDEFIRRHNEAWFCPAT